jgi:hypothetical protein
MMTPLRSAIVIPGMMGSILYYPDEAGTRNEIWSENFLVNYKRLLSNPTILRWNGEPAQAELLKSVYTTSLFGWDLAKMHLWKRLLLFLEHHPEFGSDGRTLRVGYDWRQSLLESAHSLGLMVKEHTTRLSQLTGVGVRSMRLVFFTHSMGGLVVRIALSLGAVDPAIVDRIIHIGCPLQGAPQAFGSAYRSGSLPLLRELSGLIHGRNEAAFFAHLLETLRTFPSVFQLMPPKDHRFLYYSSSRRRNPLAEGYIPQDMRNAASDAHLELAKAEKLIITKHMKVFTICTKFYGQKETELEYRVQPLPHPEDGYIIEETTGKTHCGDGTVTFESARGVRGVERPEPIWNVGHAVMCNSGQVVELFPTIVG